MSDDNKIGYYRNGVHTFTGEVGGWGSDDFPYAFRIQDFHFSKKDAYAELLLWCVDQYGYEGERWFSNPQWIFFSNETDAMMFRMNWS